MRLRLGLRPFAHATFDRRVWLPVWLRFLLNVSIRNLFYRCRRAAVHVGYATAHFPRAQWAQDRSLGGEGAVWGESGSKVRVSAYASPSVQRTRPFSIHPKIHDHGGLPPLYSDAKVANRDVALARGDRKWSLNDGRIPNPNGVRVAPGTGYHLVQGNRRASRNGGVSDPAPETPSAKRFATFCILCTGGGGGDARDDEMVPGAIRHPSASQRGGELQRGSAIFRPMQQPQLPVRHVQQHRHTAVFASPYAPT
jgi:hypothetical protein